MLVRRDWWIGLHFIWSKNGVDGIFVTLIRKVLLGSECTFVDNTPLAFGSIHWFWFLISFLTLSDHFQPLSSPLSHGKWYDETTMNTRKTGRRSRVGTIKSHPNLFGRPWISEETSSGVTIGRKRVVIKNCLWTDFWVSGVVLESDLTQTKLESRVPCLPWSFSGDIHLGKIDS